MKISPSLLALTLSAYGLACTKNRGSSTSDIVTDLDGDDTADLHLYWIDDERLFRAKCQNRNSFARDHCGLDQKSIIAQPFLSVMDSGLEDGVDEREAEITAIYVRIDQILRQMERIVTEGDEAVDPEGLRERIEAAEAVVGDQKIALHEIDQEIDAVTETLAEQPSEDLRLQLVELKEARRAARQAFDSATTDLQALRRRYIEANSGIFSAGVYDALQRQTEFYEGRRREAQEKLNDQLRQVAAFNTIQEMLHFRGFAYEMMHEQRELFVREKEFVKKFYAEFNKAWEEDRRREEIANASSEMERWCLRDDLPADQKYTRDLLMMWSPGDRCREMSQWAAERKTLDLTALLRDRTVPSYLLPFRHFAALEHVALGRFPSTILSGFPALYSVYVSHTENINPRDILQIPSIRGLQVRVDESSDVAKVKSILSKPDLLVVQAHRVGPPFDFSIILAESSVEMLWVNDCSGMNSARSRTLEFLWLSCTADIVSRLNMDMPSLRHLLVSSGPTDLSFLRQFTNLETLSLNRALWNRTIFSNSFFNALALRFPDDDTLRNGWELRGSRGLPAIESFSGTETFRQLTKLKALGLIGYRNFPLEHLPDAPIETLALANMAITDIRSLDRYSTTLRYLALANNKLEDLSAIAGFPLLRYVDVSDNKLTAQSFGVLGRSSITRLRAVRQQPALLRSLCPLENGQCEF